MLEYRQGDKIQNIQIGTKTMVGLSAVVIRDIGENKTVVGNPAREIYSSKSKKS